MLLGVGILAGGCSVTEEPFEPVFVGGGRDSEELPVRPVAGTGGEPGAGGAAGGEAGAGGALGCAGENCCQADEECQGLACIEGVCQQPNLPDQPEPCMDPGCGEGQGDPEPPQPSCDDALLNGDESDVDCGGSCAAGCALGQGCSGPEDCEEGLACGAQGLCSPPSCADQLLNGAETDVDCGGADCASCEDGQACLAGADCESAFCDSEGVCAAPSCDDGALNQGEVDIDCGGPCPVCAAGAVCSTATDCESGVCGPACPPGVDTCCQVPSCEDGVRNGTEPQTDCGNAQCGGCAVGSPCAADAECATGICFETCRAVPLCQDQEQNGSETGVDCGGDCARCPDLSDCNVAADCVNNNCFEGRCISCGDGETNGTETDVDCGGSDPFCQRCNAGQRCSVNGDCVLNACANGTCCGGGETGAACIACAAARAPTQCQDPNCVLFLQCLAANPQVCTSRFAFGCANSSLDPCDPLQFGGAGGVGEQQANQILVNTGCGL